MEYRIQLVATPDNLDQRHKLILSQLDSATFPGDHPEPLANRYWWLATTEKGTPVGFGGFKIEGNMAYLCRAGVTKTHRKKGLHRRMIDTRLRYAKKLGLTAVITYTVCYNAASINALIAKGFRAYRPEFKWGGAEMCYWVKHLET